VTPIPMTLRLARPRRFRSPDDGAWRLQAACRDSVQDPTGDVFFAPDGDRREYLNAQAAREARALAVCARCPVTEPCLAFALATGQQNGVWGGASQATLRALQRRRRVARARLRREAT
jgi:WhiB family redox-sensing transcriptional regulator